MYHDIILMYKAIKLGWICYVDKHMEVWGQSQVILKLNYWSEQAITWIKLF